MTLLQSYQSGVQAMKKVREGAEPEVTGSEASPPPADGAASSAAEGTAATDKAD